MAVKPFLNIQCPPMSLEKVWQAILRQFWRYVRPRVNPKDGFDFNEILWSFLDQSRRWGQELRNHRLPLAWRPLPSFSCSKRVTRVNFYAYIEQKLTVDRVQIDKLTFATVVAP